MANIISYVLTTYPNEVAKIVVGAFGKPIEGFFASGVSVVEMSSVFTKLGDKVLGNTVTYVDGNEQDMVEGALPIFSGIITTYKLDDMKIGIATVLKAAAARVLVKFPPVVVVP